MASASCVSSSGVKSAAMPYKTASASCITRVGAVSAASRVPWAGKSAPRTARPVLPGPEKKWMLPDGRPAREFENALRWLFDQFVGGVGGKTVPEVLTEILNTQKQVTATTTQVAAVVDYAAAVGSRVEAVVQVAQNNDLSGATAIPDDPEPPSRYADRYVL